MQNKSLTLALGVLLPLGVTAGVFAKDNHVAPQEQAGPPPQGPERMSMVMDPDRQLTHLTEGLNLTADQQALIKPLLVDRQKKTQALYGDQSLTLEDRHTKGRAIAEDTNVKIKAQLNDDQKQKFEALLEHMHRKGFGGDPGGPPLPGGSTPQAPN